MSTLEKMEVRQESAANESFQPFGFAGGLYDRDTGLVRFGARDYDAEVGRWTAKDPIKFQGDGVNLYGYAVNDPVNLVDLNGLWSVSFGAYAGAGGSVTFGRDPKSGKFFFGGSVGIGVGGGFTYNPLGGTPDKCGENFFGVTGSAGAQLGRYGAGGNVAVGWGGPNRTSQANAGSEFGILSSIGVRGGWNLNVTGVATF